MAAGADVDEEPSTWFAYSGASHHMTDQWHWLFNFVDNLAGTWLVQVVSGQTSWDFGTGDIKIEIILNGIWHRGVLNNVLSILNLQKNFLSISSVALSRCEHNTHYDRAYYDG